MELRRLKNIVCLLALAVMALPMTTFAQDLHFSQFDAAPANYNPAFTGLFDGDYRFIGNHRNQWRSVTVPYVTYGLAADAKNVLGKNGVNTGINMYYDQTGDSRFTTLQLNLSGAYSMHLASDSSKLLHFGAQLGFTNRHIDYTALQFDAQYNGGFYSSSLPNNESFARDSRFYPNLNAGVAYEWNIASRKHLIAGASLYNITAPKQSYYNDQNIVLDRRVNIQLSGSYPVAAKIDVLPQLLWSAQGTYRELVLGGFGRYNLVDELGLYRAFSLGLFARTKDAGTVVAAMDYDDWRVGLSYDINLSGLTPASNNRGGIELSVIYILRTVKPNRIKHIVCPNYL